MQCLMAMPTVGRLVIPSSSSLLDGRIGSGSSSTSLGVSHIVGKTEKKTENQWHHQLSTQLCKLGFGGVAVSCLFLGSWNGIEEARAIGLGFESSAAQDQQEKQVEPSKGNCATCIGVVDDTLGACGAALNCVSTFDDRPGFFIAPWEFPGKLTTSYEKMVKTLVEEGATILEQSNNRYIHVTFTDKDGTIDDTEFLFSDPSLDAIVNIRSASRRVSLNDNGRNQKRLIKIRRTLTWEEVPVLRNRKRKLFFLESPWDTFGPEPPPSFDYEGKLDFIPD